jgi:hypothetical protein
MTNSLPLSSITSPSLSVSLTAHIVISPSPNLLVTYTVHFPSRNRICQGRLPKSIPILINHISDRINMLPKQDLPLTLNESPNNRGLCILHLPVSCESGTFEICKRLVFSPSRSALPTISPILFITLPFLTHPISSRRAMAFRLNGLEEAFDYSIDGNPLDPVNCTRSQSYRIKRE